MVCIVVYQTGHSFLSLRLGMEIDVVVYPESTLPKTGSGKIQKLQLRAQYRDHKLPTTDSVSTPVLNS
jgi:acyl-coenzyme A synthetase/AMP-(fatty) acid ligase